MGMLILATIQAVIMYHHFMNCLAPHIYTTAQPHQHIITTGDQKLTLQYTASINYIPSTLCNYGPLDSRMNNSNPKD